MISLTPWEVQTEEAYAGLREIAHSAIPPGLKDSDREGSALSNESTIRQNAAGGLAALARAGNTAAESELLSLALSPPSGDDAVRTVAIKATSRPAATTRRASRRSRRSSRAGTTTGWVIQWGYPYAGEQFVEADGMKAFCGDYSNGMPAQYASTHDSWPEDHFEWFMGFFYLENPVERAMSLFHESIHRGTGKGHDCNDGGADIS